MNDNKMKSLSTGQQLELGLRWLARSDTDLDNQSSVRGWRDFLARAETFPPVPRWPWARWWPLTAVVSGVLTVSGLLVWPDGSGVHLLLLLLAFWLVPLSLMLLTAVIGLGMGRMPWWSRLVTLHRDQVLGWWFARQSLLAQGVFCLSGLAWLWLVLATREVIFYWSTSFEAVSGQVGRFFDWLGLGLVEPLSAVVIDTAEAGAITGWESARLADAWQWALWLSQVLALWVVVPSLLLALACQWRLRRGLSRWPQYNSRLRLHYDAMMTPGVNYHALQPEQPVTESGTGPLPRVAHRPEGPGFLWHVTGAGLPDDCRELGKSGFQADLSTVAQYAGTHVCWYVGSHAVPTGDLADLLQCQIEAGGEPRLYILAQGEKSSLSALEHSWSVFMARNGLAIPVYLVTGEGSDD